MPSFGGRAIPGISVTVGQSHAELSSLKADLKGIADELKQIRAEASRTGASLDTALGRKSGGGTRTSGSTRQPANPEYEAVTAARRAAQQTETVRRANDPIEQQYSQRQSDQRRTRMVQSLRPQTEQETKYREIVQRDREKQMEETIKRGTTKDTSMLSRGVNALGWSPFMPQSTYMMQMAMGEMGLGLSMPLIAGAMGVAGLGAAGLGMNAYAVNQQRTGNQLASATGIASTPFTANTYATGADEANLLRKRTGAQGLNLPGNDGMQAVSALAAGGLSGDKAFGQALDQTAVLVNAFGMSVTDAATMVTTMQTDMNKTSQEVTQGLASLAKVAQATGIPLTVLGQIVAQTPNMIANLSNPSDYGPAAAMFRTLGGTTEQAQQISGVANASGAQGLALAARMGISDKQLNTLQSSGAGMSQIGNFIQGQVKGFLANDQGATDVALLQAQAIVPGMTKQGMLRLGALPANAGIDAYNAALHAPTPPLSPGSAANVNALIANGQTGAAAAEANPANVKDMTVNAAQVFLTGAVSQVGTAAQLITNNGAFNNKQLQQVAAQGGVAGGIANATLAGRGSLPAAARLWEQIASVTIPAAAGLVGGPGAAQVAKNAIDHATGAVTPPGGGGSTGGQTVTINLLMNGQQVQQIPVKIGPNQQFQQYLPTRPGLR